MGVVDPRQIPDIMDWLLELYTGKEVEERTAILHQAQSMWPAIEREMIGKGNISAREAFLIMEEVIVEEVRNAQLDLAARAPFAKPKTRINETRSYVDKVLRPAKKENPQRRIEKTVSSMQTAAANDLLEWG